MAFNSSYQILCKLKNKTTTRRPGHYRIYQHFGQSPMLCCCFSRQSYCLRNEFSPVPLTDTSLDNLVHNISSADSFLRNLIGASSWLHLRLLNFALDWLAFEIIMLHYMLLPLGHLLCCYMSSVDTSLSGIAWLHPFTFAPCLIQILPLCDLLVHPL